MNSIWTLGSRGVADSPLGDNADVDVAIVGAGITGLTAALALAEAGQRVIVLESATVGAGVTGGSTGNLYATLASGQAPLRKKWGDQVAAEVVQARAAAVEHIEAQVERLGIDCGFKRVPAFRLLADETQHPAQDLKDELDAMINAGLDAEMIDAEGLSFARSGLRIAHQAQFNPLHYVQGLANCLIAEGGVIHQHSPVREIDAAQGQLRTEAATIRARHVVQATHTPKGISLIQAGMLVSREYGIGAKLARDRYPHGLPEGICWVLDPFHSLRSYRHGEDHYLIVIGEKHKTG